MPKKIKGNVLFFFSLLFLVYGCKDVFMGENSSGEGGVHPASSSGHADDQSHVGC